MTPSQTASSTSAATRHEADRSTREPFAALPHSIAGRPDVTPTEKAVLLALLFWARAKAVCWPSDRSIGDRIGRSVGTVQRALRRLEALGLVERRKSGDPSNRTGRELILMWRQRATSEAPARTPRQSSARDEWENQEKSKPPRSVPAQGPPAAETAGREPSRAELVAWATGSDPILRRIGRAALAEAGELEPAGATTDGVPTPGTTPKLPAAVHDSTPESLPRAAVPAAGNATAVPEPTRNSAPESAANSAVPAAGTAPHPPAPSQRKGVRRESSGERFGARITAPARPVASAMPRPDGTPILPPRRAWRGPGGRPSWVAALADQLRMPGAT